MILRKPKTLYSYLNMKVYKHKPEKDCIPQVVQENQHGVLFRCRTRGHDFHGYATLQEAKKAEIQTVREEIYDRKQWLEKNEICNNAFVGLNIDQ